VRPANINETPKRGELPRACANRLACSKAEAAPTLFSRVDRRLRGPAVVNKRAVDGYFDAR
jgi:septum formation protein